MAFPAKVAVESIGDSPTKDSTDKATIGPKGPPPASPKPRSASDSSLFSTVGKKTQTDGQAGLGPEGSSPSMIGMQGMALTMRGLQMLNLAFPENPGLMAIVADLTGRLQTIVPQLVAGASNGGGGMGMFPQQGMQPQMPGMQPGMPPQPGIGGMPPQGTPPMPPGAGGPPQMPQPPMMH